MKQKFIVLFFTILNQMKLKTLFLSDLHLNLTKTDAMKYGDDSSLEFLENYLRQVRQREPIIERIIFGGDFIQHSLSQKDQTKPDNWEQQKPILQKMRQLIDKIFDPMMEYQFTLGNNDMLYHNQAPSAEQKLKIYQDFWEIFGSKCHFTHENKQTFLNGGYYMNRVRDQCFFNLNANYLTSQNKNDLQIGDEMLNYLQDQLKVQKDCQFTIFMHQPFGINYFIDTIQVFYQSQFQIKLLETIQQYQEKISLIVTSHTHLSALRQINYKDVRIPFISLPSISLSNMNNPGYSVIEGQNLTFISQQLQNKDQEFLQIDFSLDIEDIRQLRYQMQQGQPLREQIMIETRGISTDLQTVEDLFGKLTIDQSYCAEQSILEEDWQPCMDTLTH